jgi:photosystem II stability/assembly factor-like uncharacterized protein
MFMPTLLRRRVLLVAALLVSGAALAQTVDSSFFSGLRWRMIGPFRGGRVLAVSGVPGEPDRFYFGSVGGGVWETGNAGRTWEPVFDDQPVASIGAIAVAPSDPKVLYVGSGEADMRSDISCGNGVYVSGDGGRSFRSAGLPDSQQIGKIAVDPRDSRVAFVAVLGHAYAPNATRGLYRTADGGKTWARALSRGDDTGAIDVALQPGHPDTIVAALWHTRRPPWNTYPPSNGPGSGLFRSADGGKTWAAVTEGLPSAGLGRIGLAFAPSQPERLYAIVDATEGGLFRSDDAGRTFRRVSSDKRIWERGWYFGGITVDPKDADVVYACDTAMYRSADGGRTFVPFKGAPGGDDYHQLWIDPADSRRMILGCDQGAVVTADAGAHWSSWYNQPTAQIYRVTTDSRFPYRVYGAQQDSGAAMVSSQSDWQGIAFPDWRPIAVGYENGYIAPDPSDSRIVFGAGVTRFDSQTLQNRDVDPGRAYPDRYRHTWTLPLLFSRRDPKVLYYANQRLFRTNDRGEHWERISPDLSRENPEVPANLDAATAADSPVTEPRRGVIYTIAPSYFRDHEIWCGTDDGLIWRTGDEGARWTNVTPPAIAPWSKVTLLEASRHDADTVYAAVDRHRLDDFAPHLFRTRDAGRTWTEIVSGIPAGAFLQSVREDPVRRGLLYAGTELGVYVSFDSGDHWQPLRLNLPVCSVRDIEVHGSDVVIATHGRSFWILDDVEPLREMSASVPGERARLFAPEPAVRIHSAQFQGTPIPKDEPIGENRARGAVLDYWIAPPGAGSVTLELRDAGGAPVRRFSSVAAPKVPDEGKLVFTRDWEPPAPALSAAAGMHRFVWDLHTEPGPEISSEDEIQRAGLWVPPGKYTARLVVDGKTFDRTLEVVRDPRVPVSDADLAAQFELSRRLEEEQARLSDSVHAAEELEARLAAFHGSPGQVAQRDALSKRLAGVLGKVDKYMMSGPDYATMNGMTVVLSRLSGALESADGAPTPDDRKGVELDIAAAEKTIAAWNAFVAADGTRAEALLGGPSAK